MRMRERIKFAQRAAWAAYKRHKWAMVADAAIVAGIAAIAIWLAV